MVAHEPRDAPAEPTSTARRIATPVALTIALVVLVALGSRAATDAAPANGRSGGSLLLLLLEVLGSVALVLALLGAWLMVTLGAGRRRKENKPESQRRVHWIVRLLALALLAAMIAGMFAALRALGGGDATEPVPVIAPVGGGAFGGATTDETPQWPPFPWVLAAVVAVLAIGGLIWWWLARSAETDDTAETTELFERALDDGLAALERETDPRRAVILAYVAMEGTLARRGLPRRSAEAPVEYMLRVLHQVPECAEPVNRLTDLFEEARFSHHVISGRARDRAVNALSLIRAALVQPAV
jgi:hypothetical protein